jgi:hypothetical protein
LRDEITELGRCGFLGAQIQRRHASVPRPRRSVTGSVGFAQSPGTFDPRLARHSVDDLGGYGHSTLGLKPRVVDPPDPIP